jgi:hypothetical protein
LVAIPGSLSVTSVGLGFEGVVIVVGDYYYNHKMRAIEKREPKRKREKVDTSHETLKEVSNGRQDQTLKTMQYKQLQHLVPLSV